jgi:ATP-dependent Clp protease ATP-binding subunit ClpA
MAPRRGNVAFSREARLVLERALREAIDLGHNHIGSGHILLGVVSADAALAGWLAEHGLDVGWLREEVRLRSKSDRPAPRRLPRRTGRVVEAPTPHELAQEPAGGDASAEALLALAADEGSTAQQALAALGIDATSIAEAIRKAAAESTSADGPVVLESGGSSLHVEAGPLARDLRRLLLPLVRQGVIDVRVEDGVIHAVVPDLGDSVAATVVAWLEAVAERELRAG